MVKKTIVEYEYLCDIVVILVIMGHCTYTRLIADNGSVDLGILHDVLLVDKLLNHGDDLCDCLM